MRSIEIQNVSKAKGGTDVLARVNLSIPSGEFFALLGPSGCGKTTLLRLIGGFEDVDAGVIYLGSQDITDLPINERNINIVFQNYALFPHLNVFDNVAYSLAIAKVSKGEIEERVLKILKSFHLDKHIFKFPNELSGGQQQRVALARAIINEPDVLLLDEPLAALDYHLREKMLLELIELQDKLETTFVYVTHDQFEALTVADHMAIMNVDGEIEQIGTPKEIYEFPISSFVAQFVGTTNIFNGTLHNVEGEMNMELDDLGTFSVYAPQKKGWMCEGTTCALSIRPEKIYISKTPVENFSNTLTGTVQAIVYHGRSTQYNVDVEGCIIQVFEQNEEHFPHEDIDYDDEVYLYWQKENGILLER
ncbi:MAG: ABC transporter ATP-binding protein [Simkaniaceae bacterium]|nr:ABC transporter ATP-binding protein [Simkaniaceae bacterium]